MNVDIEDVIKIETKKPQFHGYALENMTVEEKEELLEKISEAGNPAPQTHKLFTSSPQVRIIKD